MDRAARVAYGIGAASRLTGVSPDTLRVWERRYGVPAPSRAAGGSRSYGEADITRLRLVARAIAVGHRARDTLSLSPRALERLLGTSGREHRPEHPASAIPTARACMEALIADDPVALRERLRRAAVLLGPVRFVEELASPLANQVGELWEHGKLEVRHEHLFTEYLSAQLHVLLATLSGTETAPVVVLATFPGEAHSLGLDMVAVHLAARAAVPRLLGASCPPREIAEAAKALGAHVVGVSVSAAASARSAERDLRHLLAALGEGSTSVWLGGAGAGALRPDRRVRVVRTAPEIDRALAGLRERPRTP